MYVSVSECASVCVCVNVSEVSVRVCVQVWKCVNVSEVNA